MMQTFLHCLAQISTIIFPPSSAYNVLWTGSKTRLWVITCKLSPFYISIYPSSLSTASQIKVMILKNIFWFKITLWVIYLIYNYALNMVLFVFCINVYLPFSKNPPYCPWNTKSIPVSFCFPPFFASLLHTHILHYSYSIFLPPYTTTADLPPIYPNLPPIYTIYTIYPIYPIYPIFSPK